MLFYPLLSESWARSERHGLSATTWVAAARAVCAICPVSGECLEYAMGNNEQHGIWGGTTGRQRRRIKARRRRQEVMA